MLSQSRNPLSNITYCIAMLLVALFTVYVTSCSQEEKAGPPKPRPRRTASGPAQEKKPKIDIHNTVAVIETVKGMIEVEFFADDAPQTVENFIKNARLGYYKNEPFHRVEPQTLIQAGSHMLRDTIPIETSDHKPVRGILVMAKETGATVADASEFFICLDTLELDSEFTMFGKVTKGFDVIDSIKQGDKILTVTLREKG
ncbi:MAG: peptidylprolyl isomerase [Candidatus Poribacteria bacterium]|nr:peptidylprolyl isomerase [Candidatus Poribacteria bacterium]